MFLDGRSGAVRHANARSAPCFSNVRRCGRTKARDAPALQRTQVVHTMRRLVVRDHAVEPGRGRRRRRLVGGPRRAGDAVRDLLVSALRLRPAPRHERRRCARSDAGVSHLAARAARLRAPASGARPLPRVPARVAPALSRQRRGAPPHAEARRRRHAPAARVRRGRRPLPRSSRRIRRRPRRSTNAAGR